MDTTLLFYDHNAFEVTRHYETVDFSSRVSMAAAGLKTGARILDIGCGSGRDAALLLSLGYDVTGIDGSEGMIREAEALHPELRERLYRRVLPGPLRFPDRSFDAVFSWATLMHLDPGDIGRTFTEIHRVLCPGGLLAYSVNTERAGLERRGRDEKGRHFTCMPARDWEILHVAAGFTTIRSDETEDINGRPGIRWATFFCQKLGNGTFEDIRALS